MYKKRVYVAGPLGFEAAGRDFLYGKAIPAIEAAGFVAVDPWKLTDPERIKKVVGMPYGQRKRAAWQDLNMTIGANNYHAIRDCDCIAAFLDGPDVDSGTAAEIGCGFAMGKPIVGYRNDIRVTGDNEGATVNLQVEYFIRESGGSIVDSLEALARELKRAARC